MSYLVLARKWRPQTFEEVIGQKPITQALQNAITTGRVAHAYLFAGPRGVGKTSIARILSKALNCQEGLTGHPCDHCPSCREIREGIAVDVLEIDGASNRGIDEIRELRENVKYLPARNRYKVYIIDEVHMLTDQAFNALLKTLEEPPGHVIFILATTEPHKIPLTILSRCQRYDFRRIPQTLIVEHLQKIAGQEGAVISDPSLYLIAREAEGSLRDAQSLLDQVLSFSGAVISDQQVVEALGVIDRRLLHQTVQALADGDKVRLLEIVEEVHGFGYDLKEFCVELARLARDLLVLKVFPNAGDERSRLVDLPEEEVRELAGQAGKLSQEEIHTLFRSLLTAHDETIRSSLPRLVLEMTLTRAAGRRPVLSVAEALERLREMEERLSGLSANPAQLAPSAAFQGVVEEKQSYQREAKETRKKESAGGEPHPELSPQLQETWTQFVHFMKRKKPPLASLLEQGCPLTLREDLLEIGYAAKSFYLDRMQEVDTRSTLEKVCTEFFKRPMKVRISAMNPDSFPGPDPGNGEETGAKNGNRNKEEGVLNHPLVQEAIRIFGGRIVDIKH